MKLSIPPGEVRPGDRVRLLDGHRYVVASVGITNGVVRTVNGKDGRQAIYYEDEILDVERPTDDGLDAHMLRVTLSNYYGPVWHFWPDHAKRVLRDLDDHVAATEGAF